LAEKRATGRYLPVAHKRQIKPLDNGAILYVYKRRKYNLLAMGRAIP